MISLFCSKYFVQGCSLEQNVLFRPFRMYKLNPYCKIYNQKIYCEINIFKFKLEKKQRAVFVVLNTELE